MDKSDTSSAPTAFLVDLVSNRKIPVETPRCRVGRDDLNDIVISGDQSISRFHFIITYEDGAFKVQDAKSRHGTFLNGNPLTEPESINDGDVLKVGVSLFWFVIETGAGAAEPDKPKPVGAEVEDANSKEISIKAATADDMTTSVDQGSTQEIDKSTAAALLAKKEAEEAAEAASSAEEVKSEDAEPAENDKDSDGKADDGESKSDEAESKPEDINGKSENDKQEEEEDDENETRVIGSDDVQSTVNDLLGPLHNELEASREMIKDALKQGELTDNSAEKSEEKEEVAEEAPKEDSKVEESKEEESKEEESPESPSEDESESTSDDESKSEDSEAEPSGEESQSSAEEEESSESDDKKEEESQEEESSETPESPSEETPEPESKSEEASEEQEDANESQSIEEKVESEPESESAPEATENKDEAEAQKDGESAEEDTNTEIIEESPTSTADEESEVESSSNNSHDESSEKKSDSVVVKTDIDLTTVKHMGPTSVPDWCKKYFSEELKHLNKELDTLNERIKQMQEEIQNIEGQASLTRGLRNTLLTSDGDELIEATQKILTLAGWKVTRSEDDKQELMLQHDNDHVCLARIVWTEGRAERSHLGQLFTSQTRYWCETGVEPKGLLIISKISSDAPSDSTDDKADKELVEFAEQKNTCLMSTLQILGLYRDVTLKGGDASSIRKKILDSKGWLDALLLQPGDEIEDESESGKGKSLSSLLSA